MVVRALLCGLALATAGAASAGPGAQAGNEAADAARRLQTERTAGDHAARDAGDSRVAAAAQADRTCRDNPAMKALGRMSRQNQVPCVSRL